MEQNAKRKICIYCEKWTLGGIERFLVESLMHMDRRGLEFHLAIAAPLSNAFHSELSALNINVHVLQQRKDVGALGRTICSLAPFWSLLKREHFDVVHLNIFHGVALLFAWLARQAGIPAIIAHSHGAGLRKSKSRHVKLAMHYLCCLLFARTPTVYWAASVEAGRFLFSTVKAVDLIPNGIDTARFLYSEAHREAVRQELSLQGAYVIGCVGRLENQKNQTFLLDVLARCVNIRPNSYLLLVGDGEARHELEVKANKLGIRRSVCFLGNSDRVPALLCAMDILAVPSTAEGLSIAAVEGQASGLPVVCSTGVPREVQITGSVAFLSLEAGEQVWAEELLFRKPLDRIHQNALVKESKFQIDASTEIVRRGYGGDYKS